MIILTKNTKVVFMATISAVALNCCEFGRHSNQGLDGSKSNTQGSFQNGKNDILNSGAGKIAFEYWNGFISNCGKNKVIEYNCHFNSDEKLWNLDRGSKVGDYGIEACVIEFVGSTITIDSIELSEADKLNEVEWQGTSDLSIQTFRIQDPKKIWSKWYADFPQLHWETRTTNWETERVILKRIKGEWNYMYSDMYPSPSDHIGKADCPD